MRILSFWLSLDCILYWISGYSSVYCYRKYSSSVLVKLFPGSNSIKRNKMSSWSQLKHPTTSLEPPLYWKGNWPTIRWSDRCGLLFRVLLPWIVVICTRYLLVSFHDTYGQEKGRAGKGKDGIQKGNPPFRYHGNKTVLPGHRPLYGWRTNPRSVHQWPRHLVQIFVPATERVIIEEFLPNSLNIKIPYVRLKCFGS